MNFGKESGYFGVKSSSSSFSVSFSQSSSQQSQADEEDPDQHFGEASDDLLDLSEIIVRAADCLPTERYLTTGCKNLDHFFHGGIPCTGITELVGESGSAKTQFCLQLTLTVQLPVTFGGLAAGAIYINTESSFPSNRLVELTSHFKAKYGNNLLQSPMDKILIEHLPETIGLIKCINERLPVMIERTGNFRLIIIDSIAALFRADYDETTFQQRTDDLRQVGMSLRNLVEKYNVCVVVVNQVTASPTQGGNIPALGLAWANMITTRICASRKEDIRSFQIMFAPHLPNTSVNFSLSGKGIQLSETS